MPPYECPISLEPPHVPVITTEGQTYEFAEIARHLLFGHDKVDPNTRNNITHLIYNRSTKDLNDELMGKTTPLPEEEKKEIALLYSLLTQNHLNLHIHGIDELAEIGDLICDCLSKLCEGYPPLLIAVEGGCVETVLAMLNHQDAAPNQAMSDGATPLNTAILFGHFNIAQMLISNSSVANEYPSLSSADNAELVEVLLSKKINQTYYLKQAIKKPEFMRDILTKNDILLEALVRHENELWAQLQHPEELGLSEDEYENLLRTTPYSTQESDTDLQRVLSLLFQDKQRRGWPSFFAESSASNRNEAPAQSNCLMM